MLLNDKICAWFVYVDVIYLRFGQRLEVCGK